jgi:4-amino-4-deoxy-L-arabinose transferase-like glycosyltransferase
MEVSARTDRDDRGDSARSARSARRAERWLPVVAALIAFAAACWAAQPYAVGVFHDDGVYAILAKSLATGHGFRYLHLPGAPVATHYPPGYPLFLAALWKLVPAFPANVSLFLMANALLLAITAWATARLARDLFGWSPAEACGAAVVATISYPLLMLSTVVLAEPLFAAAAMLSLYAAERCASARTDARWPWVAGVSCGALMLVKTHGIALPLALAGVLLWRRRFRTVAIFGLVLGCVIAPWQWWAGAHASTLAEPLRGSYGSYGAWLVAGLHADGLRLVIGTLTINAREVVALFADRFSLSDGALVRTLSGAVALLAASIGAWRLRHRGPVTVGFAISYFGIMMLWPYTPWRFVFAVWPVVILLIGDALRGAMVAARISGASDAAAPRTSAWPRIAAATVAVLFACGVLREEGRAFAHRAWNAPGAAATQAIAPLLQRVVSTTRPSDLVAVDGEQLVYLFTGRQAVPVAPFTASEYIEPRDIEQNAASLRTLIAELPVEYVVTITPAFDRSAQLLSAAAGASCSTCADSSNGDRLVRLGGVGAGGVFRVERP